jgi:hypothetical protein
MVKADEHQVFELDLTWFVPHLPPRVGFGIHGVSFLFLRGVDQQDERDINDRISYLDEALNTLGHILRELCAGDRTGGLLEILGGYLTTPLAVSGPLSRRDPGQRQEGLPIV